MVVRYFGGTLRGDRVLSMLTNQPLQWALQVTPIIQKPIEVAYTLQFDYTQMNEVMMAGKAA